MPVKQITKSVLSIKEKDIKYKFWGGVGFTVGGGISAIILQIFGEWNKLIPIGVNPFKFTAPTWFMFVGSIMLVGTTLIHLYEEYRRIKNGKV